MSTVIAVLELSEPIYKPVILQRIHSKKNHFPHGFYPLISRLITGKSGSSSLKYALSGLLSAQVSDVHSPYPEVMAMTDAGGHAFGPALGTLPVRAVEAAEAFPGLPAALIALGAVLFALAVAAIIYMCVVKGR